MNKQPVDRLGFQIVIQQIRAEDVGQVTSFVHHRLAVGQAQPHQVDDWLVGDQGQAFGYLQGSRNYLGRQHAGAGLAMLLVHILIKAGQRKKSWLGLRADDKGASPLFAAEETFLSQGIDRPTYGSPA